MVFSKPFLSFLLLNKLSSMVLWLLLYVSLNMVNFCLVRSFTRWEEGPPISYTVLPT